MGYVADRWHKTRPGEDDTECGQHKGMYPSASHGKGKRWQARYDDPNGKEITSLWATKVEAEREINKQESAKDAGTWLDPKAGRVTVEQFALKTWLPAQSIIGRTEYNYEGALRRYLLPEWGHREMRSIKPSEAGAWQKSLVAKYKLGGGTPARVAKYVRSIFRLAVIDRVIPVSPFEKVPGPSPDGKAVQPPDVAQVRQLIAAAHHPRYVPHRRWATMIELIALTGLRSGEIRGLRLDRIDFLRRTMVIDQQLVYEKGKNLYIDGLKTDAGLRTLPLPQRVVDLVAAYVREYPVSEAGPGGGLLFTMPGAGLISTATFDNALAATCKRAGMPKRRWHDLRHHYASVLIAGGESPKVVQKRLGHKDVMTTLRTYAHLFAEAEEKTREVLDAAWAEPESWEASGRIPESRQGNGVVSQLRA